MTPPPRRRTAKAPPTLTATLTDGTTIEYLPEKIGEGGMKDVYFTADRQSVVCFYRDQAVAADPQRLARLDAIVSRYDPTRGPNGNAYWRDLFCWPTGIVVKPTLGIVTPAYPRHFYFADGPFKTREKEGRWFTSARLRAMLPETEQGDWRQYLAMCIRMARAVRRLHSAGLAHADLSPKNVLVDPAGSRCVVIDIDSLVVPALYAPDVIGTPGYIAPEVLATAHLAPNDPGRIAPSSRTDEHALAVLFYEYLLARHPLKGTHVHSMASAEEDERLSMGAKALFVEHPTDHSNPPTAPIKVPYEALGPVLSGLFRRAFVDGLHHPERRPAAIEWERGLNAAWQSLHPCEGVGCPARWYVLDERRLACPFCGTRPKRPIPILKFRGEMRPGLWMPDGQLVLYHDAQLFPWHAFRNAPSAEDADRVPMAYVAWHENRWVMVNQRLTSLTSPNGNRVPPTHGVVLEDGVQLRLSQDPNGRIADVVLLKP